MCVLLSSVHIVTVGNHSIFFFKQKTAYEMRISDWSSDVCSSDLAAAQRLRLAQSRHGDVETLPRLGKGGEFRRDDDRRRILQGRIDTRRQCKAKARHHALHALRCIISAIIDWARKSNEHAIAGKLVPSTDLEVAQFLQ